MSASYSALLEVQGLEKRFGGITALIDYDFKLQAGEFVGLIGPNGAGKTTIFNLLSGVLKPTGGRIFFNGRDVTGMRPDRKAALGIARTFQNIRLFNELSVIDNIKVAFHNEIGCGFVKTVLHTAAFRSSEKRIEQNALMFLELLNLQKVKNKPAQDLPYGIQRRVEIARALATSPKLLLLDEPSAGLNPSETDELIQTLLNIVDMYGLAIFLVEHDMKLVMAVCQKIQVIDRGRILTQGAPDVIRNDQRVIDAYLGKRSNIE